MAEIVEPTDSAVASVTGPIYLLLFPIPIVCFLGALATDLTYSRTSVLMWSHFSSWLIATGLVIGALASLALLVELIAAAELRDTIFGWGHIFLFYAAMIVELFNMLVHSKDGWTAVVPTGMILSVIAAILCLAAVVTVFFVPVTWVPAREVRT